MTGVLQLSDIRQWLMENRSEYLKLRAQQFAPINNAFYSMYGQLHRFIEYYQYANDCNKALLELKNAVNNDFSEVIAWTKKYEALGSQKLLMFEVDFNDWIEDVSADVLKINEGLFAERKPFADVLGFCIIFQILYWDNSIHEIKVSHEEKKEVLNKLQSVIEDKHT